jgi:Bacterial Ig domain
VYRSSATTGIGATVLTLLLATWGCGGGDITLPVDPGAPSAIVPFGGDDQSGIAGTPLPDSIVVKVTDADGNPLSGQRVVFVLADESPGALVTPNEAMTGADGTAAARWVLGSVSGTQRVVARLVSDQAPSALEARFTASATLPPAGADRLVLRVQPSSSATAGTAFDRQPVIQIRDANGNDVARAGVSVTAALASGDGVLAGTTTRVTDSEGRAEFTELRIDRGTGPHLLIFAADGYTSVTADPIEVQAAPAPPAPAPPPAGPPTARDDRYDTIEGSDHTLQVSAANGVLRNDADPEGGPLTASMASGPSHGKVTLRSDGSFSYTPESGFFGDDSFIYRARNGAGKSSTASVTIDVAPVNDSPRFRDKGDQSVKPSSGPREVPRWATDITPGADNEADQTLRFEVTNNNPGLFTPGGQPSVTRETATQGTLRFEPAPGETGSATVTVVLRDDGGTSNGGYDSSEPHTFRITVRR